MRVLDYEVAAPAAPAAQHRGGALAARRPLVSEDLVIEPAGRDAGLLRRGQRQPLHPLRRDARAAEDPLQGQRAARASWRCRPTCEEVPVNEVPNEVLHYLMPTRYCESDLMSRCAQQLLRRPAAGHRPRAGHRRLDPREHHATSRAAATRPPRRARCSSQRAGVCRDFAHLGITFCRALNIPARLVVGYVWFDEPPQDFHAGVRGLAGRAVGAVRRDAHGAGRPAGARGHRARCQGRGLLHHLRPRDA